MAIKAHYEIVQQGRKAIDVFRKKNPDASLNLAFAVLSGADLHMANLLRSDLFRSDLSGADLRGANMNRTDLRCARMERTKLRTAKLRAANLRDAYLTKADLCKADLSDANLSISNLRQANLREAILHDTNLSGADLGGADLRGADLNGTDLDEANLSRADLSGADLSGADLREANLSEANLSRAKLSGADLREANLSGANLSGAKLSGADFTKAVLFFTMFADVDLSTVKGLTEVEHLGPSSIGIDTLYKSKGKISDVFLRGCGVPEDFITYVPALTANPIDFYSCFISYSHKDKKFARRLHDALQGRGIRCWLDEKQLVPGDDIHAKVDESIRVWDKVLLCGSQDSLTSWWVDNEIDKAFKKEARLMNERKKKTLALIPLDLDGYLFDKWENGKKDQVLSRKVASFKGWKRNNDRFEEAFEDVVKALRTDDFREPPPEPKL